LQSAWLLNRDYPVVFGTLSSYTELVTVLVVKLRSPTSLKHPIGGSIMRIDFEATQVRI